MNKEGVARFTQQPAYACSPNLCFDSWALLQSNAKIAGDILAAVARAKGLGLELTPPQLLMAASLARQMPLAALRDLTAPSAPNTNVSQWSDEQIRAAVETLANEAGVTKPSVKKLMQDFLINPHRVLQQRAGAVELDNPPLPWLVLQIRRSLGLAGNVDLRGGLAQRSGIPFSAIVSRINVPTDPTLGLRVVSMLPPSHREDIAELLLTNAMAGSSGTIGALQYLDAILRSGDPFIGSIKASRFVGDDANEKALGLGTTVLHQTFAQSSKSTKEMRLDLLRTLGFTYSDILRMNPVGQALWERMDPELGSYDAGTYERFPQLPRSREQAAERILRAEKVSYRDWILLGVLSDRPWNTASDTQALYRSISNRGEQVAQGSRSVVITNAEKLLGRSIPRGSALELQDRGYQTGVNLTTLQMFGLGARQIGSGKLNPIPPIIQIESWPAPQDRGGTRDQRAGPMPSEDWDTPWQEFMPLLDPPPSSTATRGLQR